MSGLRVMHGQTHAHTERREKKRDNLWFRPWYCAFVLACPLNMTIFVKMLWNTKKDGGRKGDGEVVNLIIQTKTRKTK